MRKIKNGEIQLPDFQREWLWDDDQVKSLLESVIRGFPINSILLLECNADDTKFAFRPIQGVDKTDAKPQYLILDGQQRLTSLFGALFSDKPLTIAKGKKKNCFYYVDMQKAVDAVKNSVDKEDMIISVPPSRKLKTKGKNWDLSTPKKEYAAGMFPLNKIFDGTVLNWIFDYNAHYANDDNKKALANEFNNIVLKITRYDIVDIELEKNTPLEAVCRIFEKVNIGGEKLGVFDLLTAIFAAKTDSNGEPIKLRKDWEKVQEDFDDNGLDILTEIDCSDFITALTLLVSYRNRSAKNPVSCKGEDILNLKYADYLQYKGNIIDGFFEAGKFLDEEGIKTKKYLPYKSQLIPMAAIFAELKLSGKYTLSSLNKIRQWYWCCVFGESYKDGQGTRYVKDIVQVMDWIIDKSKEPDIIKKTQIGAVRLMGVNSTRSAAYKGMISIILKNGARDFLSGRNIATGANYAESIEIHHIFPKKFCEAQGLSKSNYDNIANKTLILKNTNRTIGGDPPSIYLNKIEHKANLSSAELDTVLEKHFIDAELCRADNFDAFIADRTKKIFDAIERLTGREVLGRN